jgi:hypothetical protein
MFNSLPISAKLTLKKSLSIGYTSIKQYLLLSLSAKYVSMYFYPVSEFYEKIIMSDLPFKI